MIRQRCHTAPCVGRTLRLDQVRRSAVSTRWRSSTNSSPLRLLRAASGTSMIAERWNDGLQHRDSNARVLSRATFTHRAVRPSLPMRSPLRRWPKSTTSSGAGSSYRSIGGQQFLQSLICRCGRKLRVFFRNGGRAAIEETLVRLLQHWHIVVRITDREDAVPQ